MRKQCLVEGCFWKILNPQSYFNVTVVTTQK